MMISECITHIGPTSVSRFHIEIHHSFGRFLTWRGWSLGSHPPIPMHTFRASYVGLPDGSLCPQFDPKFGTTTSPNLATFCNVSHKKRSSYVNFHLLRVHRVDEVRHDSWPLGLPFISSFVVDWGSLPQKRHRDFKFRKYRL